MNSSWCHVYWFRLAAWHIQSATYLFLAQPVSTRYCTAGSTTTSGVSSSRHCAVVRRPGPPPRAPPLAVVVSTARGRWPLVPPDHPGDVGDDLPMSATTLNWNRASVMLSTETNQLMTPSSSRHSSINDSNCLEPKPNIADDEGEQLTVYSVRMTATCGWGKTGVLSAISYVEV